VVPAPRRDSSRHDPRDDARAQANDPLAPIVALSAEEKIALFS